MCVLSLQFAYSSLGSKFGDGACGLLWVCVCVAPRSSSRRGLQGMGRNAAGMRSLHATLFLKHLVGGGNLKCKQVWGAVAVLGALGVASSPANVCRITHAPHRARTLITRSMAHKGAAEAEKDALKVDVAGKFVEVVGVSGVSENDVRKAVESVPFQRWLGSMKGPHGILSLGGSGGAHCSLNRVLIQNVDFFGQRVGFVKFKAEVVDEETGAKLPGIVFARGGAVGILILLECEGKKYAVLTEQARVPVGRTIMELPAGMLDEDADDFVGTAAREVEEEIGIHIKISDLVDLTALLDESTGGKMFPSPGGSDEEITLFLYRCHIGKEVIDSLHGRDTGLRDHGELIKVHVVPYDTLWRISPDSKVLAAIAIYEMALRLNLLPSPPNVPDLSQF